MPDFAFLTRRTPPIRGDRAVPEAQAAPAAVPAPSLSLTPSPSVSRPPAPREQPVAAATRAPIRRPEPGIRAKLFPAPKPGRLTALDDDTPVVRLDALRSSIGSLLVDGAVDAVWEAESGVTGAQSPNGAGVGTVVPTSGNRPLVGYEGRLAIVALRHVRELRRALFVSEVGEGLGVRLSDASVISVEPEPGRRTAVLLLVIDGLVELRVAPPLGTTSSDVHAEFGFEMTRSFDFSRGEG